MERQNNKLPDFTLCIGRQIGAGGIEVGTLLSKSLPAAFYDKEIIFHAAQESGLASELFEKADEKPSRNFFGGLFGLGINMPGNGAVSSGSYLCNEELFKIQSQVIINLASKGPSIFVGRCADYILRDKQNVFSVFLSASMDDRIARLCSGHGITGTEACSIIEMTDKKRSEYYNYYTFKTWGAAASYDMCLNTTILGVDKVVEIIENTIGSLYL